MEYDCNIPKNIITDYTTPFPGTIENGECSNILESVSNGGDQVTMDNEILSYIQERGYPVLYYPYGYDLEKSEKLFGENSAAGYFSPFKTYVMITIEDGPSWLGLEGFTNDETATIWIHIRNWKETVKKLIPINCDYQKIYNLNYVEENDIIHAIEPKVKDLIQLTTFGCDREFDRGNKIYEIVSKDDEIFSENNMVANGHYVWKVTAKRYRYSHEDGMSNKDKSGKNNPYIGQAGEKGNHPISEAKSVYHMFLEADGLTNQEADSLLADEQGNRIYFNGGLRVSTVEIEKNYNQDITKDSKNNFDLDTRISHIYEDKSHTIISNDLF